MKHMIIVLALVVGIVATGSAQEKGYGNGGFDFREGGEGQADAVPIGLLPYSDTGATCDNVWDIDFTTCGFTGGITPDVWYSYEACVDGTITISLCGSSYDTTIGVFDAGLTEIACNDDFCGLQSEVNVVVAADQLYYIVVSGFAGGCGDYVMNVTGPECPTPTEDATWGQIKADYR